MQVGQGSKSLDEIRVQVTAQRASNEAIQQSRQSLLDEIHRLEHFVVGKYDHLLFVRTIVGGDSLLQCFALGLRWSYSGKLMSAPRRYKCHRSHNAFA